MKVVGILGGMSKFEGKRGFPKGLMQKSAKIPGGGHDKLTGNLGGSASKKLISSTKPINCVTT